MSFAVLVLFLTGCSTYNTLYIPDKNYLERRNIETRIFDTEDDKEILMATALVLQDMGYTIKESDAAIGVITAEKNREFGTKGGKLILRILDRDAVYEDVQCFYVSIAVTKTGDETVKVRVTFARRSWDNNGDVHTVAKINDPELYKEFFYKLEQSVFLTGQGI